MPAGYKIAARRILKGEPILKYSVTVGFANVDIEPGTMVHSHNTEFREFDRDYSHASEFKPVQLLPESERATFQGHVRANGKVGTRNFIGVLSTVNCSATVVNKIAEWFTPERLADPHPPRRQRCHRRKADRAHPLVEGRVLARPRRADQRSGQPGQPGRRTGHIFEKSLGSSMKGGTGPLMAVYRYAEPVTAKGFVFMDTPGFDPVSATGQIAGGANLIAVTTGRGSMFGSKPAPCIKLATNSPMFHKLEEDMDINCGEILDGTVSVQEMGQRIFELFLHKAFIKGAGYTDSALDRPIIGIANTGSAYNPCHGNAPQPIDLAQLDAMGAETPVLVDLKASGQHSMEDFRTSTSCAPRPSPRRCRASARSSPAQSGLTLASLITLAHISTSWWTRAAACSGVVVTE